MSGQAETKEVIERAVNNVLEEVTALQPLKLVVGLELRGGRDVQLYRIEMPGPVVTKGDAHDAKVRVEVPRAFFNEMAKDGRVADWREAFVYGQAKATGVAQILRLIEHVVDKHEERQRTRKARQH